MKIWSNCNKVTKSSESLEGWGPLISAVAYILSAIAGVSFLGGKMGIGLSLQPNLRFY